MFQFRSLVLLLKMSMKNLHDHPSFIHQPISFFRGLILIPGPKIRTKLEVEFHTTIFPVKRREPESKVYTGYYWIISLKVEIVRSQILRFRILKNSVDGSERRSSGVFRLHPLHVLYVSTYLLQW